MCLRLSLTEAQRHGGELKECLTRPVTQKPMTPEQVREGKGILLPYDLLFFG